MADQSHHHAAAVYHDDLSQQLVPGLPDKASDRFLRSILLLLIGLTIATGAVATSAAIQFDQADTNTTLLATR